MEERCNGVDRFLLETPLRLCPDYICDGCLEKFIHVYDDIKENLWNWYLDLTKYYIARVSIDLWKNNDVWYCQKKSWKGYELPDLWKLSSKYKSIRIV